MSTFGRRRFLGGMAAGGIGSLFPWVAKAARISPVGETPTEKIETVQVLEICHRFAGRLASEHRAAITDRIGHVNAEPMMLAGALIGAETLLFQSADIRWSSDGDIEVVYRFRVLTRGWNNVPHPVTKRLARIRSADGQSLYPLARMGGLPWGTQLWIAGHPEPLIQPTWNVRVSGRRA